MTYLLEAWTDSWTVQVTVHLECGLDDRVSKIMEGSLSIYLDNVLDEPIVQHRSVKDISDGEFSVTVTFSVLRVNL